MKSTIFAAVVLAPCLALFGAALAYEAPAPAAARHVEADAPVSAEPTATAVYTVPEVVIVARRDVKPAKVAHVFNYDDCAFDSRPLVQGSGSVRGWCGQ